MKGRLRNILIRLLFTKKCRCSIYFRPLLKLVDRLLLVGMLTDEDVVKLLIMKDPETWDESFQKGNCCNVIVLYKCELRMLPSVKKYMYLYYITIKNASSEY
jgi:hypothetical protein